MFIGAKLKSLDYDKKASSEVLEVEV